MSARAGVAFWGGGPWLALLLLAALCLVLAAAPAAGAPNRPPPHFEVHAFSGDQVRLVARATIPDYRPRWESYLVDSHGLIDCDRGLTGFLRAIPGARMLVVMWARRDGTLWQARQLFVYRNGAVELLEEER